MAFQLTNIIRDVGEDARRNRIYLPLDELAQFDVSETDILNSHETDNVRQLLQFQIDRAQGFYERAFGELPSSDRRAQRPGLMMAAIYRTLLNEIKSSDCLTVLNNRISLTPLRKLWLAWTTWITT
jgi:phytoene synthase